MKHPVFTGCATAIVTPFTDHSVDYNAFRKLIDRQIESGINALVVCGTTGEVSTMTHDEQRKTIETALEQVNGRIPVIAGTGANCTEIAIQRSKEAKEMGADALLLVTPYYNKTTQTGLVKHYSAIADSVQIPCILYNVPSRTGVSCTAETYMQLSRHPQIIGVKEASGNFSLIQKTLDLCGNTFNIWSGNDEETAAIMMLGGAGVISVVSNAAPAEMVTLTKLCLENRFKEAGQYQIKLRQLCEAMFCEVNPIPIKAALHLMGLCESTLRLPLCEISHENYRRLEQTLQNYALL